MKGYALICLEETLETIEKRLKEYLVNNESIKFRDVDILTYLKRDELIPEKPLWVLQQENKKLWRK